MLFLRHYGESGRPRELCWVIWNITGTGLEHSSTIPKRVRWVMSLRKSTLSWLSNGTLVLWVVWCLKQGTPLLPLHLETWKNKHWEWFFSQQLEEVDHHHRVSGGHTVTFSYLLMAEIVSSLFPRPPQYFTSYLTVQSPHGKSLLQANGCLHYVQGLIKIM